MPNLPTDTTAAELIPSEPTATDSATPKWDKVEQERLTRRAALRKMGYTSGIAMFSLFAVDDLARMAIKKMEQHKETRQIAEAVAREFKNSGIALAGPYDEYSGDPCLACQNAWIAALNQPTGFNDCYNQQIIAGVSSATATTYCNQTVKCPHYQTIVDNFNNCLKANNCSSGIIPPDSIHSYQGC